MSAAPPTANYDPTASAESNHESMALAFASDPRIHFNTVTETWQFEDDDGKEMEWDAAKQIWVPLVDEDLVRAQQAAYKMEGVDEDAVAAPFEAYNAKKRKNHPTKEDYTSNTTDSANITIKRTKGNKKDRKPGNDAVAPSPNKPAAPPRSKNTAVYVTHLPLDTTASELNEAFSKFGIIEIDDEDQPKIKLYHQTDPDTGESRFSGEALVVYFKEESVDLAIRMLDDAELRLGDEGSRMAVKKAEFGHKEKKMDVDPPNGNRIAPSANTGEHKPRVVDKKKATKRIGKMQSKLNDWDDEDGFGPTSTIPQSAASIALKGRVVVLKHMFSPKDLEEDASLLIDLKNDVRDECETLGDVTNVVLYDLEEDGVMTVKFRDSLSAQACILKMNGRFFDGRQVSAYLFDGKEKFKKSGGGGMDMDDEDDDVAEKKRLEAFASWLEQGGEDN
ncbi:hypothetical protein FRC02_010726 [Tulasnella sp. 418]|nr:hypothetical protein FRC02_010726 [Tulasnella sp. 418]